MANLFDLGPLPRSNYQRRNLFDPSELAQAMAAPQLAREQGKVQVAQALANLPAQILAGIQAGKDNRLKAMLAEAQLIKAQKEDPLLEFKKGLMAATAENKKADTNYKEKKTENVGKSGQKPMVRMAGDQLVEIKPGSDGQLTSTPIPGTRRGLNAKEKEDIANLNSGLREIKTAREILKANPTIFRRALVPGGTALSPQAQDFKNAISEIADIKTRKRTGAALNANEEVTYGGQVARFSDSPETVLKNLDKFEKLYGDIKNGIISGSRYYDLESGNYIFSVQESQSSNTDGITKPAFQVPKGFRVVK